MTARVPAAGPPPGNGRTLIVVPALNEEASLPAVLAELAACTPACDVLVVDDGSDDRTADVARQAGAVVAVLPFNLGIGGALRTGFRYARRQGYDHVVQFDADGQHDAQAIARLLEPLSATADMVIGSRFVGQEADYRVGRARAGAMALLRVMVRLLTGQAISDTSSGFRAFNARAIGVFAAEYPRDYMDSVEALLLAIRAGLRVVEVPVHMRHRRAGTPSTRNLLLVYHYLRLSIALLLTVRRRRPSATE